MTEGFYLGIDAAAHGSLAALADDHGTIQAYFDGPGVRPGRVSALQQQRLIRGMVDGVLTRAGVREDRLTAMAVGMSGAESSRSRGRIDSVIQAVVPPIPCLTECPAILALRAATRDAVGVGLVVDHRTSCVGRDRYGRRHAVGGHGAISGDVGYAEDLAMRALGSAWMAEDGRAGPSSLSAAIPEAVGVDSVQRLSDLRENGELPTAVVEAAVACLFAEADGGDGLAEKIIEDTGSRLGAAVVATMRTLNLREANAVVVLDGAMFGRHPPLAIAAQQRILSTVNEAHVILAHAERVLGAVLFARDLVDHAPLAFADRVRGQAGVLIG